MERDGQPPPHRQQACVLVCVHTHTRACVSTLAKVQKRLGLLRREQVRRKTTGEQPRAGPRRPPRTGGKQGPPGHSTRPASASELPPAPRGSSSAVQGILGSSGNGGHLGFLGPGEQTAGPPVGTRARLALSLQAACKTPAFSGLTFRRQRRHAGIGFRDCLERPPWNGGTLAPHQRPRAFWKGLPGSTPCCTEAIRTSALETHTGNTYPVALLPWQPSQAVEAAVTLRGQRACSEPPPHTAWPPSSGRASGGVSASRAPGPPLWRPQASAPPTFRCPWLCAPQAFSLKRRKRLQTQR